MRIHFLFNFKPDAPINQPARPFKNQPMNRISFTNEILMFNGIEFRVSGVALCNYKFVERITFEHVIETGRPNDSMLWNHLTTDRGFFFAVVAKIKYLLPK